MKKIELLQLSLLNFKGVRELKIDFGSVTNVFGTNGTGKTTICDAFLWLFFGKDSTDRKDFQIKTLDAQNNVYHKMSHEVTARIRVDGDEVVIRRTFKENWPTKRGTATETFSGHTTAFYWNDVPMNETEYKKKVSAIVDENLFKLITNTGYFSSLKWQDRRNVLEQMAGTITNEMVFEAISNPDIDFGPLMNALGQKKTLAEFKSEINSKKKMIKDEKELLPSRIDEAKRGMPAFMSYDTIEKELAKAEADLVQVEELINNKALQAQDKQRQVNEKVVELQKISARLHQIESDEKSKVSEAKNNREADIRQLRHTLNIKQNDRIQLSKDIESLHTRKSARLASKESLSKQWHSVNTETVLFNDKEFKCPTCNREFDSSKIEEKKQEMTENFNANKSRRLAEITQNGQQLAKDIEGIDAQIAVNESNLKAIVASITALEAQIDEKVKQHDSLSINDQEQYEKALATNQEYHAAKARIDELNAEISTPITMDDNDAELKKTRSDIQSIITDCKSKLATKAQRTRQEERIKELENQESELAIEQARLEGIEFSIFTFEEAKMNMLQERVNLKFSLVKFKMFEDQINGGRVPCCETLVNGVPYSDVNTAGKVQAGLDIINTLCQHYNISAPIFIDNRESVVELPESESQIVNLWVSESDQVLRIEQAA